MRKQTLIYLLQIILVSGLLFSCKTEKKQEKEKPNVQLDFGNELNYKYIKVTDSLQMAYLDLGQEEDPLVLLLHGEPNSSFVYRNIAPALMVNGFRVVIPDLIGFGNSDKPNNPEVYTYANHTLWLRTFIEKLNLDRIHLFAHDWGAMISLRIIAEQPERFNKVAISYGYLFEGLERIPESFLGFRNYAKTDPGFSAGNIMDWGSYKKLSDSIKEQYDAPLKNTDFTAARRFPWLIPDHPESEDAILNRELNKKLKNFEKPLITIWGNHEDPMWVGKDTLLQNSIAGAHNQTHYVLESNHFIQEDKPEELVQILTDFFQQQTLLRASSE